MYRQQCIGSYVAVAKLRGKSGHCAIVAGVALVAENVNNTRTLATLVESNSESEVNVVLLITDRYLLYPSAIFLRMLTLFTGYSHYSLVVS